MVEVKVVQTVTKKKRYSMLVSEIEMFIFAMTLYVQSTLSSNSFG